MLSQAISPVPAEDRAEKGRWSPEAVPEMDGLHLAQTVTVLGMGPRSHYPGVIPVKDET